MKIIESSVRILPGKSAIEIMRALEYAGRMCYASHDKITEDSHVNFIKNIIKNKHFSVLEHESVSVEITCSRSLSHELVRHRICSFSQCSQRYINYGGKEIEFILPGFLKGKSNSLSEVQWINTMKFCADMYNKLIENGHKPQEAREVLPNSTATSLVMTANLREWRHIFELRCSIAAHPDMRDLMLWLLTEMYNYLPIVFEDIYKKYGEEINGYNQ